jgi:hypothetical protein
MKTKIFIAIAGIALFAACKRSANYDEKRKVSPIHGEHCPDNAAT